MTAARRPIPDGRVSSIRGRWQIPAMTWLIRVVLAVSLASAVLGGPVGRVLAIVAVAAVVAAPLTRVCWLILRWTQEHDGRFVLLGVVVIAVVTSGAVLATLGVGG